MQSKHNQSGMTMISWVVVLLVLGFFFLIILRMFPIYIDRFKVNSSMESLKIEPELSAKSVPEIRQLLLNRLDINDVDIVVPGNILIERADTGTNVTVKYEDRKNLFGDVDVVVRYDRKVSLSR
jgi:hypothetical protein